MRTPLLLTRHSDRKVRRKCLAVLGVAAILSTLASPAHADEWPQWFGPQRDGVWYEKGILRELPETGPTIRWRVPVHAGYTGPAVAGGRVFLMDRLEAESEEDHDPQRLNTIAGQERILCFNADDGKQLWEHAYDCEYRISYPAGPRTTPLVDGDRVYALGAMGNLFCLNADDGAVIWSKSFMEDYDIERPLVWGWSASPLLDGDRLICLVGGRNAGVVAFDKKSGEEIWKSIDAKEIGYAPPALYEANGHRQLLVWHDVAIQSLDPETGKRRWRYPFPEGDPIRPVVTIINPLVFDNHVMISDFYHGSLVLTMNATGDDAEPLWISPEDTGNHTESLNTLMATPIFQDGHIYGISGAGELRCLKADTGDIVWRDLKPTGDEPEFFATTFIVPNGDRYFLVTDQGELIIAKLSPAGYEEISRAKILEPSGFARGRNVVWSHPAFAYQRMYARNDKELICVELGAG